MIDYRSDIAISTHAPLRGATIWTFLRCRETRFLLTRLCEARRKLLLSFQNQAISTHAPLRGATVPKVVYRLLLRFLLTRLCEARLTPRKARVNHDGYFYSRASARRDLQTRIWRRNTKIFLLTRLCEARRAAYFEQRNLCSFLLTRLCEARPLPVLAW